MKGLSVHGAMTFVSNSIGFDGYVADEKITACCLCWLFVVGNAFADREEYSVHH